MTTDADIVNRALQTFGTRTTVTSAELSNNSSNEAIQANLSMHKLRQQLLRMAPWNCGLRTANLTYITSVPGTPENVVVTTTQFWTPGIPAPPWAYEYQYPVDCLKACSLVPQVYAGGPSPPITTAVTGFWPTVWTGPAIPYKVATDQFFEATAVAIAGGGTGYAAQEIITLAETPDGDPPIGAPAQVRVLTVNGSGVILTCELVNQILDASPSRSGSYFTAPTNPVAQSSTTGSGTGATFNLTVTAVKSSQRVILTNQQNAILNYVADVTDPDLMDPDFQDAWCQILGSRICIALSGDKTLANMCVEACNKKIEEARKNDGNEGLIVNDVLPDWIRARGYANPGQYGFNGGFDWGGMWPLYS